MNKLILKRVLSAVVLVFSSWAFADTATVVSVVGKVEVSRNDSWVALKTDSFVSEGEVISTGFKSEAVIRYKDSIMKLGPLTRITLEKLSESDTKADVSVFLNTGAVRSTVNHTENKRVSYTVRNPIAVASVRGTDFTFLGNARVICHEGAVAVIPAASVDVKRALGIARPADETEQETESEETEVTETAAPAEGESTAFTVSSDINPNLPKASVLLAGQTTDFTDTTIARAGTAKTAATTAESKVSSGVSTASDNESVATTTASAVSDTPTVVATTTSSAVKKGSISITTKLND